jgi:hypothetical protein
MLVVAELVVMVHLVMVVLEVAVMVQQELAFEVAMAPLTLVVEAVEVEVKVHPTSVLRAVVLAALVLLY